MFWPFDDDVAVGKRLLGIKSKLMMMSQCTNGSCNDRLPIVFIGVCRHFNNVVNNIFVVFNAR